MNAGSPKSVGISPFVAIAEVVPSQSLRLGPRPMRRNVSLVLAASA
jgi:hypothetical protein